MTIQPRRILWPTDFSAIARCATPYARAFCDAFGSELFVLHVVAPTAPADLAVGAPAELPVAYPEPDLLDAARRRLAATVQEEFGERYRTTGAVLLGNPWAAAAEYAREQAIDLIVLATHGRTGLPHVLLGSVAERIVQHAPCAVLVVKEGQRGFVAAPA